MTTTEYTPTLLLISEEPSLLEAEEELRTSLAARSWSLFRPGSPEALDEWLWNGRPACVVLDWGAATAARMQGAAERVMERFESYGIPVIGIVPAEELEELSGKQQEADEILTHPVTAMRLASRVLKQGEKHLGLMQVMRIDPPTGAWNSRALRQELEKRIQEMRRTHEPVSLVYVTLDRQKEIARTGGYAAADRLGRELADFFKGSMRPADSISLHEDGSFVLILPLTGKEDAIKFMTRRMQLWNEREAAGAPEGDPAVHTGAPSAFSTFSARILEVTDPEDPAERYLQRLPFPADRTEERRSVLSDVLADEGATYSKRLKIAVIDDDRLVRELLSHQLTNIGDEDYDIEVRSYEDGEAYFSDPWHRQNERFVVIIDRIMPKMDGLEVLQRIRARYDRRRYLCVMLTSRNTETEIALAIQQGANDYMIKPFSLKELRARLRRLVRGLR